MTPHNSVIDWFDWGTLWKSRTSKDITVAEWRKGVDRAHETHVCFIPNNRTSSRDMVQYQEHVLHYVCDKSDTKTIASNINRTKTWDYLHSLCKDRNLDVNVKIDISDGPLNQYKNKGAFGCDQSLARKYGWDVLHSFSVTGCMGKGKS